MDAKVPCFRTAMPSLQVPLYIAECIVPFLEPEEGKNYFIYNVSIYFFVRKNITYDTTQNLLNWLTQMFDYYLTNPAIFSRILFITAKWQNTIWFGYKDKKLHQILGSAPLTIISHRTSRATSHVELL